MYHKSILSEVQNLFFTLKNLSLRKVQIKLKGNYFKGLGFGVQTKRTSDRVTRETDTFRSICKVIVFRLHIYSVNTYHIHITEPFRSGKKAFPF